MTCISGCQIRKVSRSDPLVHNDLFTSFIFRSWTRPAEIYLQAGPSSMIYAGELLNNCCWWCCIYIYHCTCDKCTLLLLTCRPLCIYGTLKSVIACYYRVLYFFRQGRGEESWCTILFLLGGINSLFRWTGSHQKNFKGWCGVMRPWCMGSARPHQLWKTGKFLF